MDKRPLDVKIFSQARGVNSLIQSSWNEEIDPGKLNTCVVLTAFASELFLKCLILMETGKSVRGHNLKDLYDELAPATQAELEDGFNKMNERHMNAFVHVMKAATGKDLPMQYFKDILPVAADAFIEWRYQYEFDNKNWSFNFGPLPVVLQNMILKRRPEWRNAGWRLSKDVLVEIPKRRNHLARESDAKPDDPPLDDNQ